jgi:RNA 2',3'-cyclic 3'-phosphodiesterase
MRIFLAINPPADVRGRVWEATAPLRELSPDVSWVAEPKIHLTLKFIGEVSEDRIEPLALAMAEIARTHAAPVVHLATVGAFPNFRRPRVIWMGIEQEPRLELLHHDVELACDRLGHELDGRPYRPHLTLARVRQPLGDEPLKTLRMAAKRIRFTDEFHARTIDVMQSVPGHGGSQYTVVASAPMRGG